MAAAVASFLLLLQSVAAPIEVAADHSCCQVRVVAALHHAWVVAYRYSEGQMMSVLLVFVLGVVDMKDILVVTFVEVAADKAA